MTDSSVSWACFLKLAAVIVREEFDPVALVDNGTATAACDWLG